VEDKTRERYTHQSAESPQREDGTRTGPDPQHGQHTDKHRQKEAESEDASLGGDLQVPALIDDPRDMEALRHPTGSAQAQAVRDLGKDCHAPDLSLDMLDRARVERVQGI